MTNDQIQFRNKVIASFAYKLNYLTQEEAKAVLKNKTSVEEYLQSCKEKSTFDVDQLRTLYIVRTILAILHQKEFFTQEQCKTILQQQYRAIQKNTNQEEPLILIEKLAPQKILQIAEKCYNKGLFTQKDWNFLQNVISAGSACAQMYEETIQSEIEENWDFDGETIVGNVDDFQENFLFPQLKSLLQSSLAVSQGTNPPQIGDYSVVGLLGKGGWGEVYLAKDPFQNDQEVAIKLLRSEVEEKACSRFKQEAGVHSCLKHPNIVQMYEFSYCPVLQRYYLVMEYVSGKNIQELLKEHSFSPIEAVKIGFYVATAMKYGFQKNIIHRDIKPANILIASTDGCVKLADFGLGKILTQESILTGSREIMGTPYYMAPEQIPLSFDDKKGAKYVDHRADIYSLGATLYHLICGQAPYSDNSYTLKDFLKIKQSQAPKPLIELVPELSPAISAIINKTIASKTRKRYQTYDQILQDLREVMESKKT